MLFSILPYFHYNDENVNSENYLVLRLKIGKSSKPNIILAQIGFCSINVLSIT